MIYIAILKNKKNKIQSYLLNNERVVEAYNLYKKGHSSVELGELFNVHHNTILRAFERNNLPIRSNKENSRKYKVENERSFKTINTAEKAYWLGFIYADGYISIRKSGQKIFGIALSSIDEDMLFKLNNFLKSEYLIKRYMSKGNNTYKNTQYSRLIITSDKLVEDLIKNGVVEHKTNILKPPNIKENLIKDFIRGYLDGDGSIIKSKSKHGGLNFTVGFIGTEDLLNYISIYLLNKELINKINKYEKRKKHQIVSNVRYGGNIQAQRILDHLYSNTDLYLSRKYNVYRDLKEYNNSRSYK
ncbi:LAGLIDADG family homing endonuclease [Chengkuizengella marina]|uniref:DOD-type homing endonuclease domain-containing protein n=1 Tax=Chengkuizengella marina TaxID=2507566 RepID=A0A6N9Q7U8_9BACL|nr:LAGLIDADG family homing endonuclease [Chengkuizengella marina]NBI30985.1 hypothetical protein [Chengkuizengella marina]